MKRIVLAYSGSVATTAAVPWLIERHGAEVVTVTLDVGQGSELAHLRERALAAGAVRAHVLDARDEFVRRQVLPALRSGAFAETSAFATAAQTRPLVARRLADLARMESATAVAHGYRCEDPERMLFEDAVRVHEPSLDILAPACEWTLSDSQVADYARRHGILGAPAVNEDLDANLLGRTFYGTSHAYKLTRAAADAPADSAYIELELLHGTPIRTNGVDMPVIEIIESIETIAGAHGVGRVPLEANVVAESPAAVVLHAAYAHLANRDADLTGIVTLKLAKGTCEVVGSRTHADAEEAVS